MNEQPTTAVDNIYWYRATVILASVRVKSYNLAIIHTAICVGFCRLVII
jgi:hypothetical protein